MKTHYDVLNLEKNCSAQDIKDSYIKLSKKYHPDKNKSSDAHKKFVEVNEAYSVLGKSNTRQRYDESLLAQKARVEHSQNYTWTGGKTPYDYYSSIYAANMRRRQQDTTKGHAASKLAVVFCFILMALGSGLQYMYIQSRVESHRRAFRSQEIATVFREVQDRSKRLGKAQIIKEFEERVQKNKMKQKEPSKE